MKTLAAALAIAALIIGAEVSAGVVSPLSEKEARSYAATDANTGYLIGSFSYSGYLPGKLAAAFGSNDFRLNSYWMQFRSAPAEGQKPLEGRVGAKGTFLTNKYPKDFELPEGVGSVFVVPLPAGRYTFYQYEFFQNAGNAQQTWTAKRDFDIPFDIAPGRATYIGELRANNLFGKNLFGITMSDGAAWQGLDESERDLALLVGKYPFLKDVPVDENIIAAAIEAYYEKAAKPLDVPTE